MRDSAPGLPGLCSRLRKATGPLLESDLANTDLESRSRGAPWLTHRAQLTKRRAKAASALTALSSAAGIVEVGLEETASLRDGVKSERRDGCAGAPSHTGSERGH